MAAIAHGRQMHFFNENVRILLKFHWSIDLDNGLVLSRRQIIIWTNAGPVHWRIYATLGGIELIIHCVKCSGDKSWQAYANNDDKYENLL